MPAQSAKAVVRAFWRLMATNDFSSVASVLAAGFTLEYPQSQERIRERRTSCGSIRSIRRTVPGGS